MRIGNVMAFEIWQTDYVFCPLSISSLERCADHSHALVLHQVPVAARSMRITSLSRCAPQRLPSRDLGSDLRA
jgi:hypothetical protein